MAHYLGIDLGTSAIKAVVVDDAQVVRAQATQPIETTRRDDGRVVQDPDSWWSAVGHIGGWLKHAHAAAMADVRGIGLCEQMQDAVLIGDSAALLRPAIIWSDARSNRQCAELVRDFPELVGITGVLPMPRFTAPKLMWICEHAPDVDVRIVTVLLPNDYLRFKMTGEGVSDMSDTGGSGWLDEAKRKWSPLALETTRTQLEWMPNLVEGNALAGTAAQVFVSTQAYRPAAAAMLIHALCHAMPKRWFQMAAMLNSASCLAGAAHVLGRDIGALPEATAAGYSGPSDLLFLRYLSSERSPHNNRMARGVLFGAAVDTDAVAVTQAVLEGVAFSVADAPDSLSKALTEVAAALVGGIAQSKLWTTILANLLNIPLIRYVGTDTGPAFGAARPARPARMALTGEPAETVVVARERFRNLYRALRDHFESAAQRRSNRPALERH